MRKAEVEKVWDKQIVGLGTFIKELVAGGGLGALDEGVLNGFSVKIGVVDDPGVLCVVKCTGAAGAVVAFIGGRDLEQVLYTWRDRSRARKMRWRSDLPWGERGGGSEG